MCWLDVLAVSGVTAVTWRAKVHVGGDAPVEERPVHHRAERRVAGSAGHVVPLVAGVDEGARRVVPVEGRLPEGPVLDGAVQHPPGDLELLVLDVLARRARGERRHGGDLQRKEDAPDE